MFVNSQMALYTGYDTWNVLVTTESVPGKYEVTTLYTNIRKDDVESIDKLKGKIAEIEADPKLREFFFDVLLDWLEENSFAEGMQE